MSGGHAAIAAVFTATGALIVAPIVMDRTHHQHDTSVWLAVGIVTLAAIAVSVVQLLRARKAAR